MTRWLADTNVILRWALPHDPLSAVATGAVKRLYHGGDVIHISAQNLIEFWSVATRPPTANGLGLSADRAAEEIDRMMELFPLVADTPSIFPIWRQLVQRSSVLGRQVHDARLVAVMLAHGLTHVLTFNTADFRRYPDISVVTPQEVMEATIAG